MEKGIHLLQDPEGLQQLHTYSRTSTVHRQAEVFFMCVVVVGDTIVIVCCLLCCYSCGCEGKGGTETKTETD